MSDKKSNYETAKEWYAKYILEESSTPVDDISELIDRLSDKETNDLLSTFQEDMEKSGKPIPYSLK